MKNVLRVVLAAVLTLAAVSCVNYHKIGITSVKLGTVTPTGFKSVVAMVKVGVENKSCEFTISDIEGTIYRSGTDIGSYRIDDVTIPKGTGTYSTAGEVVLNGNISVFEVISAVSNFSPDEYTLDLALKVKAKGGAAFKIKLKNIAVSDLVGALNEQV